MINVRRKGKIEGLCQNNGRRFSYLRGKLSTFLFPSIRGTVFFPGIIWEAEEISQSHKETEEERNNRKNCKGGGRKEKRVCMCFALSICAHTWVWV